MTDMGSSGKGAPRLNSTMSGRQDTCGITRTPLACMAADCSRTARWPSGPSMPPRSAVQLTGRRLLAHHVEAHGGVPDERADVDRGAAPLDRAQELAEGLEGPVGADPRAQRVERHTLHLLERAKHEVAMRGPRRGDAEAAVPHHHRGDAVPGRDGQHAIPEDLRIVVRVDVDEAGTDDRAV